ncbi:hypothetical protein [Pandoraea sputorum]|uniref:hypothetical protein n=1 Tax=Pandoraea sputorum TaxID=93222 RepID=UPI001240A07E|nr:hypothetical protein [Pandoraea sputorum]VVE56032.1 hypothetical protein PSP20601_05033 [Pandoraea sputorum]
MQHFKVFSGTGVNIAGYNTQALTTHLEKTAREVGAYVKTKDLYVDDIAVALDEFTYDPAKPLDLQMAFVKGMKHRLGTLTIRMPECEITSQHLKDIAYFISYSYHAHTLERIYFDFSSSKPSAIGPRSFEPVLNALANLKSLKSLNLNLNKSKFNKRDVKRDGNFEILNGIAKSVSNLRTLQSFSLGIVGNNFSERSFNRIFNGLARLPDLRRLSINMSKSKAMGTEACLRELKRLKSIKSLEELYMIATMNPAINDRVVNGACYAWRDLEKLKRLRIDFTGSASTADSVNEIAKLMAYLNQHNLDVGRVDATAGMTKEAAGELFGEEISPDGVYALRGTPWKDPLLDVSEPVRDWDPAFTLNFGKRGAHRPKREWKIENGRAAVVSDQPMVKRGTLVKFGRE